MDYLNGPQNENPSTSTNTYQPFSSRAELQSSARIFILCSKESSKTLRQYSE